MTLLLLPGRNISPREKNLNASGCFRQEMNSAYNDLHTRMSWVADAQHLTAALIYDRNKIRCHSVPTKYHLQECLILTAESDRADAPGVTFSRMHFCNNLPLSTRLNFTGSMSFSQEDRGKSAFYSAKISVVLTGEDGDETGAIWTSSKV